MEWLAALGFLGLIIGFLWAFRASGINEARSEMIAKQSSEALIRIIKKEKDEEKIEIHFDKLRSSLANDWAAINRMRRKSGKINLKNAASAKVRKDS